MTYTIKNTIGYIQDFSYPTGRRPVKFTAEYDTFNNIEDAENAIIGVVMLGWGFSVDDFDIVDEAGNAFKGNFEEEA